MTYLKVSQIHLHHLMNLQTHWMYTWVLSWRGRRSQWLALMMHIPAMRWMCLERHVEDARMKPKNLWNASERVRELLEWRGKENTPRRASDKPYDPGGEMAIPSSVHSVQECPRSISNECANETDTLHWYWPPGRTLDQTGQEVLSAIGCAERLSKMPNNNGKQCDVKVNALCWDRGPGDSRDEQEAMEWCQGQLGPPKCWWWCWIWWDRTGNGRHNEWHMLRPTMNQNVPTTWVRGKSAFEHVLNANYMFDYQWTWTQLCIQFSKSLVRTFEAEQHISWALQKLQKHNMPKHSASLMAYHDKMIFSFNTNMQIYIY